MTATAPAADRPRLAEHVRRVSPLQWKLLAAFLVLGLVGAGVYAAAWLNRPAAPSVPPRVVSTPAGASGFVGSRGTADEPVAGPVAAEPSDSWAGWSGQKGAALGFGFVGGFVVGFVFRAFLKVMALITLVVGGGLAALSYYHILNIDFTAAQHAYASNAAWLTDQAARLKDVVLAHLPSSSTGAVGAFFGARRR